jgi:hypothetical protein
MGLGNEKRQMATRGSAQFWAGLILVAFCWVLNWDLEGLRTHVLFFPQWLGYCLVVDGLVCRRKGVSLLTRDPGGYVLLFILSAPVWWLFEGLNLITGNWHYLGRESFTNIQFFLLSSLSFSTVIPAVFSTAELLSTFRWTNRIRFKRPLQLQRQGYLMLHLAGWLMLILMILFPKLFFPFLWLSLFFILDPLNAMLGNRSLFTQLGQGRLQNWILYGLGALICGFFWELWNFYAFPKWVYEIPYLEVLHIFEMPLAGYGGYIPFGWELYALYAIVSPKRDD